jgi:hypothetical protein
LEKNVNVIASDSIAAGVDDIRGCEYPRRDVHEGALSSAVLAQQRVDLTASDFEVHAVKRSDTRE